MSRRKLDAVSLLALVIALVAVAALVVASTSKLQPSPLASGAPPEAVIADVAVVDRSESFVAGVTLQEQEGFKAVARASGVVTKVNVTAGDVIESGDTVLHVNDKPAVAMMSQAPLHRALEMGDEGEDVSRLQGFLKDLGHYDDAVDGAFGESTSVAVEAFNDGQGIGGSRLRLESIMWIGAEPLVAQTVKAQPGLTVGSEVVVAVGPPATTGVSVDEPRGLPSGDHQLEVNGAAVDYSGGSGVLDDAESVKAIEAAMEGQNEGAGTIVVSRGEPVKAIPSPAVVVDADDVSCVFPSATADPVVVEPVGSGPGVTHVPQDVDLERVLANPSVMREDLACDS